MTPALKLKFSVGFPSKFSTETAFDDEAPTAAAEILLFKPLVIVALARLPMTSVDVPPDPLVAVKLTAPMFQVPLGTVCA